MTNEERCMEQNSKVAKLIGEGRLHEAISLLDQQIIRQPESDDLYFQRGKLLWRMGDRAAAMNDYNIAKNLNPDSPAVHALEQAYDVANFFNPDLFNP